MLTMCNGAVMLFDFHTYYKSKCPALLEADCKFLVVQYIEVLHQDPPQELVSLKKKENKTNYKTSKD